MSGAVIDPVAFAAALTDIATEITNSLDRLGRGAMLSNIQMGGFGISGLAAAVLSTDAARLGDVLGYLPAGALMDFAMSTAPLGWLIADGSAVSRITYATLFTAVGVTWGPGDGSTTFNLPNLQGYFRRGWDNGRGIDPGRAFASSQADNFAAHTHLQNAHSHPITDVPHTHLYNEPAGSQASAGPGISVGPVGVSTGSSFTGITATNNATAVNQNSGGTETTVKNYAVLTCIRT